MVYHLYLGQTLMQKYGDKSVMTQNGDFQEELIDSLCQRFNCSRRDAEQVARQADQMRASVESQSGGMGDFDITVDLILDKLDSADDDLSIVGKWNWYAGSISYIDQSGRDFKI